MLIPALLALSLTQPVIQNEPAELIRLEPSANTYVNLSPLEGWTFQISTPFLFGGQGATAGVMANKTFALGQALGWTDGAERVGLGVGAQIFAPLTFQQLYLGASLGIGHSTPIGEHFIDYGLRYAPLVAVDWFANTSTGYNGILANLGFHYRLSDNNYTTIGVQGGYYAPFTGPGQGFWTIQPLLGLNLGF